MDSPATHVPVPHELVSLAALSIAANGMSLMGPFSWKDAAGRRVVWSVM